MRFILFFILLAPIYFFGQDTVFISNTNDLKSIVFKDNTIYLLEKNAVFNISESIHLSGKTNITIGSYGAGAIPEIKLTDEAKGDLINIRSCKNITVENLNLYGDGDKSIVHIAGHYLKDGGACENITIKNCELAYGFNGVRAIPYNTKCEIINIINCNIHHFNDDGIFIKSSNSVTINNNHIWHVNLYWNEGKSNAGDCIHLVNNCDNWSVRNNILDRRFTSNKFCFIFGSKTHQTVSGELIGNTFYPPKDTIGGVGSAIYISTSDYVKIDSNIFRSDGYDWGGKAGAIAHIEATEIDFSRNYIHHLTNCNFTPTVQRVNIFENTLIDCFSFVFKYNNECIASDNKFYNLKGWAYVAGKSNSAKLTENNTSYFKEYPSETDSIDSK